MSDKPWNDPWHFTVTWDPDMGPLPTPILRLFRGRSTITPGSCVMQSDKGHSTYYERAVKDYLTKHRPDRSDVSAVASPAPEPPVRGAEQHTTQEADK